MDSFLSVCTEWGSAHGGVPSFNRALTTELARHGHRVGCVVLEVTPEQRADAESRGVELLEAHQAPDGPVLSVVTRAMHAFRPDVVIGHDRVSGSEAHTLVQAGFLRAALLHIVHTAPREIEPYKDDRDATRSVEQREDITKRIATGAAVVAAVGPRLHRETDFILTGADGSKPVLRLDPGLEDFDPDLARQGPLRQSCLIAGRMQAATLKGLDIAAKAFGLLPHEFKDAVLTVRGADPGQGDALRKNLAKLASVSLERIDVREYTADAGRLKDDLYRATAVLMPSRVEGFGLIGHEAIAAGTPVLVSSKTGLAELLEERAGAMCGRSIVALDGADAAYHEDVERWAKALEDVFRHPGDAFAHAKELRATVASQVTWDRAIDDLLAALDQAKELPWPAA